MRLGIIDIGSNTIRLHIYKFEDNRIEPLFTKKVVAGLVTYIDSNYALSLRGIKKLISVLETHKNILNLFNVKDFFIFATASLRGVSNINEVIALVKKSTDLDLTVLSQDEEAKLGFKGISLSCSEISGYTIDIGGGSTEIVSFNQQESNVFLKLDFGCLSIFKRFVNLVLPTLKEIEIMTSSIKQSIPSGEKIKKIFGIGGTVRAVGNILSEYLPNQSNTFFTYDDVCNIYQSLISGNSEIFRLVLQVTPERVHTIIPGTLILKTIMESFSIQELTVCKTGLREGVLLSHFKLDQPLLNY